MAFSQKPVQQLADRVGHGEEEDEQYPHHGRRLGPDAEPVARADGLRHDLPEGEDERDGDEDGDVGRHERVEEYGQRLHGERVADEERAEEQVLVLHDGQDLCGVELVLWRPRLGEHLEVDEAERHEPEGEARHEAGEHDEPHAGHEVDPEHGAAAGLMAGHRRSIPPSHSRPVGGRSASSTLLGCKEGCSNAARATPKFWFCCLPNGSQLPACVVVCLAACEDWTGLALALALKRPPARASSSSSSFMVWPGRLALGVLAGC